MNNNLRELRLKKGLTQENVAFELDISQKAYSKIENEKVCLSQDKMKIVAKVLDVPIDNLCALKCECSNSNSKINAIIDYMQSKGMQLPDHLK